MSKMILKALPGCAAILLLGLAFPAQVLGAEPPPPNASPDQPLVPIPSVDSVPMARDSATGSAVGSVVSEGAPVPYAQISLKGKARVFEADARGRFLLPDMNPGRYVILATALGYETREQAVEVNPGQSTRVTMELKPAALTLNPIVVTGTMRETFVSESPVKVDVVKVDFLKRKPTSNLMEAIGMVNGLYSQVDCGVCYPNNIRINGMEGAYTAVLIDGAPIMSALASVYGLNGINPAIIEQLEILKGPSSTLYGSEAMGGVVNIVTKDPRFTPRYSVDLRAESSGSRSLDFSYSPGTQGFRGLLSGSVQYMDRFLDENGDGFADLPKANLASFFGKLSWRPDGEEVLNLAAKYYYEDRWGGVKAWTPELRGSTEVYGESVFTHRVEILGKVKPTGLKGWELDFSYAWHDQDAMYGDTPYIGDFQTYFANLTREGTLGGNHHYLVGLTARHHIHDDNTVATEDRFSRFIPGVFFQDEYAPSWRWSLLGGMRLDHHQDHGVIASPRLSAKWSPTEDGKTTLRINGGTGFRVVNTFSEEFASIVHGSRDVLVGEALDPERSWSVTGNLNQILEFDGNPMMVDVDLFYTRFNNQLVADYDMDPRLIVFRNLHGKSVSRGISLSLNQNFSRLPILYSLGITFQDVYSEEDGVREDLLYSPAFKGVATLTWELPRGITLDYAGTLVGSKRLPQYEAPFQRKGRSPVYALHDLKGALDLGEGRQLYAAVENLFDWTQESPLVDAANPFSDHFDTAYVYGPIYGRQFLLGFRMAAGR